MLFDDDVVADGKPKPGAFSGRFGREEWIEHLCLYVRSNASAIVPDRYFDAVPEVLGGGSKGGFVAAICFRTALRRGVKPIGNKIEQGPCNLLREQIGLAGHRVKRTLQRNVEALLLGARPVIGKVQALLDDGIDIDNPVLAGAFP